MVGSKTLSKSEKATRWILKQFMCSFASLRKLSTVTVLLASTKLDACHKAVFPEKSQGASAVRSASWSTVRSARIRRQYREESLSAQRASGWEATTRLSLDPRPIEAPPLHDGFGPGSPPKKLRARDPKAVQFLLVPKLEALPDPASVADSARSRHYPEEPLRST
jgi:hypothetical protein